MKTLQLTYRTRTPFWRPNWTWLCRPTSKRDAESVRKLNDPSRLAQNSWPPMREPPGWEDENEIAPAIVGLDTADGQIEPISVSLNKRAETLRFSKSPVEREAQTGPPTLFNEKEPLANFPNCTVTEQSKQNENTHFLSVEILTWSRGRNGNVQIHLLSRSEGLYKSSC